MGTGTPPAASSEVALPADVVTVMAEGIGGIPATRVKLYETSGFGFAGLGIGNGACEHTAYVDTGPFQIGAGYTDVRPFVSTGRGETGDGRPGRRYHNAGPLDVVGVMLDLDILAVVHGQLEYQTDAVIVNAGPERRAVIVWVR